jgi:hypothetical protein
MRWVIGAGRCGLHNYTEIHKGIIESPLNLKLEGIKKYHGNPYDKKLVDWNMRKRASMDVPCFADCGQFMFIEEIIDADPKAEFVWLRRVDREAQIKSFMKRVGEAHRIHPNGWKFETARKRELIEWYIDEVNKIILQKLTDNGVGSFLEITTESMPDLKLMR